MRRAVPVAALLLLLFAAFPGGAAEYFVAPGGDDGGPGTELAPFGTIAHASSVAVAGDTVTLRGGDYTEQIQPANCGTAGLPITYQGYAGETARIVGNGATVADRSWITFRRLSFVDSPYSWIYGSNTNYLTVEECAFDGVTADTGWGGIWVDGGTYLTIRGCRFFRWCQPGGDMVLGWPCDYVLIENNDFRNATAGHSLMNLACQHVVIRGNYFQNLSQKDLDLDERLFQGKYMPGRFMLVENNTIVDSPAVDDPLNDLGGAGIQCATYNSIYRYNVLAGNERYGVKANAWSNGDDIAPGVQNNRFYSNTFYGNGWFGFSLDDHETTGLAVDDNVVANNLFLDNGANDRGRFGWGRGVQLAMNLTSLGQSYGNNSVLSNCFFQSDARPNLIATPTEGAHPPDWWNTNHSAHFSGNLASDPRLSNAAGLDFRLTAASPCVDAGRDLTQATNAGSASTALAVADAWYFSDGFGLVSADWIQIGTADPVQIASVDAASGAITLTEARTWSSGDPVNLYKDSTGRVVLLGSAPDIGADERVPTRFKDVEAYSWAYAAIEACVDAGIVGGYSDQTYRPGVVVTRDQMAVFIARALAGGDASVPTHPGLATFPDIPDTGYEADGSYSGTGPYPHWAFKYVDYCVDQKIVGGYPDGKYWPLIEVNRGQMAVFIARAMAPIGERPTLPSYTAPTTPSFADVLNADATAWMYREVEYIHGLGVVNGYPEDGLYHPELPVTRDQMAVFITRAFGL